MKKNTVNKEAIEAARRKKVKLLIDVYVDLHKSADGKVSQAAIKGAGYSYDQVRYYFGSLAALENAARKAKPAAFTDSADNTYLPKDRRTINKIKKKEQLRASIVKAYSDIAAVKGYTSMSDMVAAGYSVDTVAYHFRNLTLLNREARQQHPEKFFDEPLDGMIESGAQIDKLNDFIENTERFIVTTAVTGCRVDSELLSAMKTYCHNNDAKILVLVVSDPSHNYFSPGSKYGMIDRALVNDDDIAVVVSDSRLNSNVHISTVKLSAKQMDPVTSMERIAANHGTFIFASPKQRLKSVAISTSDFPHFVMTTGSITVSDYSSTNYMSGRTAFIADHDHVMGGLILEIEDEELYHFRQFQKSSSSASFVDLGIRYYPDCCIKEAPHALVLGDWHAGSTDPTAKKAWEEVIEETKPKNLFMHDSFDGLSINHHERNNTVLRTRRAISGQSNLECEIYNLASDLGELRQLVEGCLYIVKSNHDEVLIRYLKEGRFVKDSENAKYAAGLFQVAVDNIDPLQHAVEQADPSLSSSNVVWLLRSSSYKVCGVELALHGDKGPNGARGTIQNLERSVTKLVKGHTHAPEILRGAFQTGTSSYRNLEYNDGPSSWMHSSCLIYEDGSKQLINSINGKWKL